MKECASKLSVVQQEYIETIYSLCKDHDHAHTKQIASALDVSMPTVVEALITLSKSKMINYRTRHPVTLTPLGKEIARELNSRQKVFTDFFTDILGLEPNFSDKTACSIEHVVNEQIKERLSAFNAFMREDENNIKIINNFKKKYESI